MEDCKVAEANRELFKRLCRTAECGLRKVHDDVAYGIWYVNPTSFLGRNEDVGMLDI